VLIEESGDALAVARIRSGGREEELWGGQGFEGLGQREVLMEEQAERNQPRAGVAAGGGEEIGVGMIED